MSGLAPAAGAQLAQRKPRPPGYWRDFWLGFFGVIAANFVVFQIVGAISAANLGAVATVVILVAPWVLNLAALITFAIIRPRVALGMLLAYGIALGCALLVGIVIYVICFGSGSRGVP